MIREITDKTVVSGIDWGHGCNVAQTRYGPLNNPSEWPARQVRGWHRWAQER